MKTLLRYILVLIGASLLLILIAGLIGKMRPTMPLATFMTNPDGSACEHACVFGIIPGVTTADQAYQILAAHPLTRSGKWNIKDDLLAMPDGKTFVTLGLTEDQQGVDIVSLTDTPFDSGIPAPGALIDTSLLGEFILKFGNPIVGLPGSNYFVIEYPGSGIIAAVARPFNHLEYVAPNAPMAMLAIVKLTTCERPLTFQLHNWMGFKKMQRYFDDHPNIQVDYRFSKLDYPPPYLHCDEQPQSQPQ